MFFLLQKCVNGMSNSVDSDQTAPERAESSLIWFYLYFSDVSESQSELTGVPENFPTDTLSQGITFRDPETGVLYVQTQLLQVRLLSAICYACFSMGDICVKLTSRLCIHQHLLFRTL